MENEKKKYPYKDPLFSGIWIYDKLPENMRLAKPNELYPGKQVIYNSLVDPTEWIAEKVSSRHLQTFRQAAAAGRIYIQDR